MSLSSRWFSAISAVVAMLIPICGARGQTADPGEFYNLGVHAYFAGQSSRADEFLSRALSVDPQDPRAYYFRGLSRLRQGRSPDARTDMQIGASIEAQQPNRFAVGRALERVQGGERILLEQYRQAGRVAESSVRTERNRQRYEQVVRREAEVLHRRATISLGQLTAASGSRPVVVWERSPQPVPASAVPVFRPAASTAAASSDNPFPDDPTIPTTSGAPAAAGRPIAASTVAGSTSRAPVSPAAADENPFGTPTAPGSSTSIPPSTAGNRPATTPQPASADENPFRAP